MRLIKANKGVTRINLIKPSRKMVTLNGETITLKHPLY